PRDLHSFPTRRSSDLRGPATFEHYLVYAQSDDRSVAGALRRAGLPAAWVPGMTFTRTKTGATAFVPWPAAPYRLTVRGTGIDVRSEEHTSELQSPCNL